MSQVKTYGSGRKTKAQEIADAERQRELMQIKEADLRASLLAVADTEIQKVAADIVLEKEKKVVPPDPAILKAQAEEKQAQREADEVLLTALVEEHEKDKAMFYRFMKSAMTAALRDMERSQETARIASRLGRTNPITSGVMGVGEASGVIQDQVKFVEAICKRFAIRYRAIGSISADDFESPVGT